MPTLTTLIQSRLAQPAPAPDQAPPPRVWRCVARVDSAARSKRSKLLHRGAQRRGPRRPWSPAQGMSPLASVMPRRRSSVLECFDGAPPRSAPQRHRHPPREALADPLAQIRRGEPTSVFSAELPGGTGHATAFYAGVRGSLAAGFPPPDRPASGRARGTSAQRDLRDGPPEGESLDSETRRRK